MTQQTEIRSLAEQLFTAPLLALSPTQQIAINLYELGMNVFPVPHGKKGGWAWRKLQYVRLNPEHIYPLFRGWCNTAVMMGRTSGNLFVIDCETAEMFRYHEAKLKAHGIPIWGVKTGSKRGGGHFYLRCSEGEIKGFQAGDYEVRGNRCYVLAPVSLHPDGGLYDFYQRDQYEPPTVKLSDMPWLPLQLTKNTPPPVYNSNMQALSNETRNYIFMGASEGERNNRLFKAACDLAGNNFQFTSAMDMLQGMSSKVGLPDQEIYATIKSAYSQPRTPARPTHKPVTIYHWQVAQAWGNQQQWKGRAGQTDRVVFLACCERAKTANKKGVFRASSREVAELAGVSRKTVSLSLNRLVDAGILVFAGKGNQTKANLYRLAHKTVKNSRNYSTIPIPGRGIDSGEVTGKNAPLITITHDIAEWKALGKTAYNLYRVMVTLDKAQRAKPLAERSKLNVKQVYRALKKLKGFGLVVKVKGGFKAIAHSDHTLNEQVAIPAGTYGKTEARKLQHQRERATRAGGELYRARFGTSIGKPKSRVTQYKCGNCGQIWGLGDIEPPLVCDYCNDVTTWKLIYLPS